MDELFGNTFGDDLFEENTKKSNVVVESYPNWSPHRCEPQVSKTRMPHEVHVGVAYFIYNRFTFILLTIAHIFTPFIFIVVS